MLNSFRRPINLIALGFGMSMNLKLSPTPTSTAANTEHSSLVCRVASKSMRHVHDTKARHDSISPVWLRSKRQMGQSTANARKEGLWRQKPVWSLSYRFSRVHQPQWASPAPTQSPQLLHWSHWATFTLSICGFASSRESRANQTEEQLPGEAIHVLVLARPISDVCVCVLG